MTGQLEAQPPDDGCLHAGMRGAAVGALQEKLRSLGYPAGAIDGIFGEQTYRAIGLFQHDHDLDGDPGIWQPSYDSVLAKAGPMLPQRQGVTHRDLEKAGDKPIQRMNFLQRIFAWLFGGATASETFGSDNVLDSINGIRAVLEPLQNLWFWASTNRWLLLCAVFIAVIALIRVCAPSTSRPIRTSIIRVLRKHRCIPQRRRPYHERIPGSIASLGGRL